jgi:hypothetical protein
MNIHVHVERLLLDRLPVSQRDATSVRSAVERELARLIIAKEFPADRGRSSAASVVAGKPVKLGPRQHPDEIGQRIAESIFAELRT